MHDYIMYINRCYIYIHMCVFTCSKYSTTKTICTWVVPCYMQHDSAQLRFAHQMLLGFLPECGAARGAKSRRQHRMTDNSDEPVLHFKLALLAFCLMTCTCIFFYQYTRFIYVCGCYVRIYTSLTLIPKNCFGIPEKTTAKLIPKKPEVFTTMPSGSK